jgi:hypothetical protein
MRVNWISPEMCKNCRRMLVLNILSWSSDINTHQASIMTFESPISKTNS